MGDAPGPRLANSFERKLMNNKGHLSKTTDSQSKTIGLLSGRIDLPRRPIHFCSKINDRPNQTFPLRSVTINPLSKALDLPGKAIVSLSKHIGLLNKTIALPNKTIGLPSKRKNVQRKAIDSLHKTIDLLNKAIDALSNTIES